MASMLSKEDVVSIIVEKTNLSKEQVEQEIEKTMKNMDYMINEEGAAFIVANNLGVVVNPKKAVDARPVVRAEGRRRQAFPVVQIADGIVGPSVADRPGFGHPGR